jgi:hypothetical protein
VHPPTERTDFADRCIRVPLARHQGGGFEAASRLAAAFQEARPRLFGGLLNALATTLAHLPSTSRAGLSRMSDFHWYGRAASQALGCDAADFDEALAGALARQRRLALEDALAQALVYFAHEHARGGSGWEGTAEALRQGLLDIASRHQLAKGPAWPKSADALGRRLDVLQEALHVHGIVLERQPRGKKRTLTLSFAA